MGGGSSVCSNNSDKNQTETTMNKIEIRRENGGLGRMPASKDGVVGLLMYVPTASKTAIAGASGSAWAGGDVAKMGSAGDVEKSGLKGLSDWHAKVLEMHLKEIYRQNAAAEVYVGVYDSGAHGGYEQIEAMQRYAGGEIRVMGVWEGGEKPTTTIVKALQAAAGKLESEQMPLSVIWSCGGTLSELKSANLRGAGQRNVSVAVCQDGDDGLYGDSGNSGGESTGMIGVVLGMVSKAPVNESISWVERYPSGVATPSLADGTKMRDVSAADMKKLDENGYMMLTTYPGIAGSYVSDTHTMDEATSDYAHLEDERTMDKAARGVYASMVKALGGKVYAAEDGSLREDSRAMIEVKASAPIEQMERDGELSGYRVEVSGDQVLKDGKVKAVIKNQPTGVVRELEVSIGYAASLE